MIAAALPSAIQAAALQQIRSGRSAAISVAVVARGRLVSDGAFGRAGNDTAFSVGSVTKMFTAVAVMQLAQQRRISLEDRAAKYLPQYPALQDVSIRQLLNHTSGIPNYLDDAFADGDIAKTTAPAAILASALNRPFDFAPGSDWNYSNTGYVVLGQIVERVSGLSLSTYERRNIFAPLGMRHTYVAPALGSRVASPFGGSPGNWSWYYAVGDVFSTARDLARFDIALMNGRLLKPEWFETMQQTVPYTTLIPGMRDGLGVFVSCAGPVRIVGHHGGEPGFRADDEMIPERDFAVAILGSGAYPTAPILSAALHAYSPNTDFACKQADADGAPTVTQRLTGFLHDVARGAVDETQLEPLARVAVPQLARRLRSLGGVRTLRFLNKTYTSTGKLYGYQAVLAKGTSAFEVLIGRDNKIASLALVPETP